MLYQYRIPVSGPVEKENSYQDNSTYVKVENVMSKMGKYKHLFPSAGGYAATIKGYTFEEGDGQAKSIAIETYARLNDGKEKEFADCLQRQLVKYKAGLQVKGELVFTGVQGRIPEKLYHITDKRNLDMIWEKGLIPRHGPNCCYQSGRFVYLCSQDMIAPWIAILPEVGDMALLEIDTAGTEGVEPGRTFTDHPFKVKEFRTREIVPPKAIREVGLAENKKFARGLVSGMENLLYQCNKAGVSEIQYGFGRLQTAGLCTEKEVFSKMEEHRVIVDAYKDYLFSVGYYVSCGDNYWIDGSCPVKPMTLSEFHGEMASFQDSIYSMGGQDNIPER